MGSKNRAVRSDGPLHHSPRIHCRSDFYQGNENQALGLFRVPRQHQGNHLPSIFILLGNFERTLLLSGSSEDY